MEGVGGSWSQTLPRLYAFWQVQFQEYVKILMMCGHHSIIYRIPIIIFNTLSAECVIECSTLCCVGEVFENISFTETLNTATISGKQLHISVVYDHHWTINTVV